MMKRVTALLLTIGLLFTGLPPASARAASEAIYVSVVTEHGVTLRDQTLMGDLALTEAEPLYIDGALTFAGGGGVRVTGGEHVISRDAVINGDIVVEAPCTLEINGIVNGTVRFADREEGDEAFVLINEQAVVRQVEGSLFVGDVVVRGNVAGMRLGGAGGGDGRMYGNVYVTGSGYVGGITLSGENGPYVTVEENALVSSITHSGGADITLLGGEVQRLTMGAGAKGIMNAGSVVAYAQLDGLGATFHVHGGTVGEATVRNTTPENTMDGSGLWLLGGASAQSVSVEKGGLLCTYHAELGELDAVSDTPVELLEAEKYHRETYVGDVTVADGGMLEHWAKIGNIRASGRKSRVYVFGQTDSLTVKDSQDVMIAGRIMDDQAYDNNACAMINARMYGYNCRGTVRLDHVNLTLGCDAEVGTLLAYRSGLTLYGFTHVGTMVVNSPQYVSVMAGDDPAASLWVDHLFYGGNPAWTNVEDGAITRVRNASALGSRLFLTGDVERLFLPDGEETYRHHCFADGRKIVAGQSRAEGEAAAGTQETQGDGAPAEDAPAEGVPASSAAGAQETQGDGAPTEGVPASSAAGTQETQGDGAPAEGAPAEDAPDAVLETYYIETLAPTALAKARGQAAKGGLARNKAVLLKPGRASVRKNNGRDWWFALDAKPMQTLNVALDAGEGMGCLTVYAPDGQTLSLTACQGAASGALLCATAGVYELCLTGAANDYTLESSLMEPAEITWPLTLRAASENGKGDLAALDLREQTIGIVNETQGTEARFLATADALYMTADQASAGDTLTVSVASPQDAFVPFSQTVRLNRAGKASLRASAYAYGSFCVSLEDAKGVAMHLYDADGAYLTTLERSGNAFTAGHLAAGEYRVAMLRGGVARWRFDRLDEYQHNGLVPGRDYREEAFTLKEGRLLFWTGKSVPAEPTLASELLAQGGSGYRSARGVCLQGGNVLLKVDFELEPTALEDECTVEVRLSRGMSVSTDAVTLDGKLVPCTVENDVLCVPVTGVIKGCIAFYASAQDTEEILSIARLCARGAQGERQAYLGFVGMRVERLSLRGGTRSCGTVHLFGTGAPGQSVTLLRDGQRAGTAYCDLDGKWNYTSLMEPGQLREDHVFQAALYKDTQDELLSEKLTVTVGRDFPELQAMRLYYYEHEYLRKLELTGDQIRDGGLRYSYLPGTTYTCVFKLSHSDRIEALSYFQLNDEGETVELPCAYDAQADEWTVSGVFGKNGTLDELTLAYDVKPEENPPTYTREQLEAEADAADFALSPQDFTLTEGQEDESIVSAFLQTSMGADFSFEMSVTTEDVDPELIAQEAAAAVALPGGGTAYVMTREEAPYTYLVIVGAPDEIARLGDEQAPGMLERVLAGLGLVGRALAEEEQALSAAEHATATVLHAGLWKAAALPGTAVKTGANAIVITNSCLRSNALADKSARLMKMAEEEERPEVRLQLLTMADRLGEMQTELGDEIKRRQSSTYWTASSAVLGAKQKDINDYAFAKLGVQRTKDWTVRYLQDQSGEIAEELTSIADKITEYNTGRSILEHLVDGCDETLALKRQMTEDATALINEKALPFLRDARDDVTQTVTDAAAYWRQVGEDAAGRVKDAYDRAEKEIADCAEQAGVAARLMLSDAAELARQSAESADAWRKEKTELAHARYEAAAERLRALASDPELPQKTRDVLTQYAAALGEQARQDAEALRTLAEGIASGEIDVAEETRRLAAEATDRAQSAASDARERLIQWRDAALQNAATLREAAGENAQKAADALGMLCDKYRELNQACGALRDQTLRVTGESLRDGQTAAAEALQKLMEEQRETLERLGNEIDAQRTAVLDWAEKNGQAFAELCEQAYRDAPALSRLVSAAGHEQKARESMEELLAALKNGSVEDGLRAGQKGREEFALAAGDMIQAVRELAQKQAKYNQAIFDFARDVVAEVGRQFKEEVMGGYENTARTSDELMDEADIMIRKYRKTYLSAAPPQYQLKAMDNGAGDPSGYVYEGMWSNRLSGVTATAYTRDASGQTVRWDAGAYGQKNPLTTDADGYYEWYVPDGDWQVTYQKEGYEDAGSAWMAVPPPQTEVHQALVSLDAPEVRWARYFGDTVELCFAKPVKADTVREETLSIGAPYTVEPLNPERGGDERQALATRFCLTPQKKLGGRITLEITEGVRSYADVGAAARQIECVRQSRLEGLEAPAAVEAVVGETVDVVVRAVGKGDFSPYSLAVTGLHDDLITVEAVGAFDSRGRAIVRLRCVSPCEAVLRIRAVDTEESANVRLTVAAEGTSAPEMVVQ